MQSFSLVANSQLAREVGSYLAAGRRASGPNYLGDDRVRPQPDTR